MLIAFGLCLGPALLGLRLAVRNEGRARVVYAAAALLAAAPFLAVEVNAAVDTLRSFDGYCHHAPDIRYACSLPRALAEATLPSSPFALFGFLMIGAVSCIWDSSCCFQFGWS